MITETKDSIATRSEYPLARLWEDVRSHRHDADDFLDCLRTAISTFTYGRPDADEFSQLRVPRKVHMYLISKASYLFSQAQEKGTTFQEFADMVDAELAKANLL